MPIYMRVFVCYANAQPLDVDVGTIFGMITYHDDIKIRTHRQKVDCTAYPRRKRICWCEFPKGNAACDLNREGSLHRCSSSNPYRERETHGEKVSALANTNFASKCKDYSNCRILVISHETQQYGERHHLANFTRKRGRPKKTCATMLR